MVNEIPTGWEFNECLNTYIPDHSVSTKNKDVFKQFESGAVRDIQKGKGRCDLLPLDIVGEILDGDYFLEALGDCIRETSTPPHKDIIPRLESLLRDYLKYQFEDICTGFLELSIHFEEGAENYKERNWELGIPVHSFLDSAARHRIKMLRGDTDERHDRAFGWNILCAIWTIKHKPELLDIYYKED